MYEKGICKYNKMINCREQKECNKCSWNPTYYEQLKEKTERKQMQEGAKQNE